MIINSSGVIMILLSALTTNACASFVTHPPVFTEPRSIPWPSSQRGSFTAIPRVPLAQQVLVADLSAVDRQGPDSARCSPLMMAKQPKQGKGKGMGKVGRMDLIESIADAESRGRRDESDGEMSEEGGNEEKVDTADRDTFSVDRLKAETKTPFRTVRVFLYGGFGVSALIGGFTALSQLAATLSNQPGALELQKVLVNLLVDFGVMALAAFCYNFETSQQENLERAEADARDRRQRLEATKITSNINAERVQQLRGLRIKVPGTGTGKDLEGAKEAPIGVLMDEAKQSFCVLAGGKEFLRDSIVSAMLSKNQVFSTVNLLVVPVDTEVETAKGFGPKSISYEEEGYVAAPVDVEQWRDVMTEELEAAERQGAVSQSSSKDGIVLVVSREGKVLRRGVGIPVWKTIQEDVEPKAKK